MQKYECVFCGEPVETHVTALLAITEWEQAETAQQAQQFFCHLPCLKKAMKHPDYVYIGEAETV